MCGIVGYTGAQQASPLLLEGLKKLEYRGYDSAGIAVVKDGKISLSKVTGRIANLSEKTDGGRLLPGCTGIGHTRWATHGAPTDTNAHPHVSNDGRFAVVHNGIIENYLELREELTEKGYRFSSETDTEVIVHLVEMYYAGDFRQAVMKASARLEGSYALGIVCADEPDRILVVREASPLILGVGVGENFFASDVTALVAYTRNAIYLEDGQFAELTPHSIQVFDCTGNPVPKKISRITWDIQAAEKGGYEHFMLKEIHEQPKAIEETLMRRLNPDNSINLDGISMTREDLENFNKVYIVACGTAYHAGLVGKLVIEKMARIPVEVDIASEFRYRDPFVDDKTLFIAISQSGETLDTLAALREAKSKGARVLSVVNVVGSSVARESDDVFYTWAGPEIAVASTKAYTTQLICMYLIALYMGRTRGLVDDEYYEHMLSELKALPDKVGQILDNKGRIEATARKYYKREKVFFVGRGLDSGVSFEGSLKLKEISYINSFAIAAGELKHGTIALMEEDALVFALATQDFLYEKMVSNVKEIAARGARIIGLAKEGRKEIAEITDETIYIPEASDEVAPVLAVIPLQLFAYYVARERGCNIDKPKNLAKSVTVE